MEKEGWMKTLGTEDVVEAWAGMVSEMTGVGDHCMATSIGEAPVEECPPMGAFVENVWDGLGQENVFQCRHRTLGRETGRAHVVERTTLHRV